MEREGLGVIPTRDVQTKAKPVLRVRCIQVHLSVYRASRTSLLLAEGEHSEVKDGRIVYVASSMQRVDGGRNAS